MENLRSTDLHAVLAALREKEGNFNESYGAAFTFSPKEYLREKYPQILETPWFYTVSKSAVLTATLSYRADVIQVKCGFRFFRNKNSGWELVPPGVELPC